MNNYELHMKTHTCYDDCQNPVCVAVREATAAKPPTHSEQWWRHEVSNAWAEGYEKGRLQREWIGLTDEEILEEYRQSYGDDGNLTDIYFAHAIEAKLKEKNHAI